MEESKERKGQGEDGKEGRRREGERWRQVEERRVKRKGKKGKE